MSNKDLEEEVFILKKRISTLEKKENRRKAFKIIKGIITLFIIVAILYGIWYLYNYITEYIPNYINESVSNLIPDAIKDLLGKK